jgi:hypothetical protein
MKTNSVFPSLLGTMKQLTGSNSAVYPALLLVLVLVTAPTTAAQDLETIDPSGNWQGLHGNLTLMLSGDALSFTYYAVFGATAHICDGAGVAGLEKNGEYRYVDEQGTVAFFIRQNRIQMRTVKGIASFCGANWAGDDFTRKGYKPPIICTVASPKAYFYVVQQNPPTRRKAYVIKGDRLEVVPAGYEGGNNWYLARFKGPKAVTVGLLIESDLNCP